MTPRHPARAARRPVVGVMGSSTDRCEDLAAPLGAWLAGFGAHLLTGGGGGVMAAVSEAFATVVPRDGLVVGILPAEALAMRHQASPAYPNPWVEIPIYTHLPVGGIDGADPRSRNHINILTADAVIVLPGGDGTRSEAALAVHYGRPAIAWFGAHLVEWTPPAGVRRAASLSDVQRFVRVCVGHAGDWGVDTGR